MNPFAAKYSGDCKKCKQKIKVGEMIQARSSSPWVHVGCTVSLNAECVNRVHCWRDSVKNAGFTEEDGNENVWVRDTAVTWCQLNEHYVPMFAVAYDEDEQTVVPEFSFTTYDPEAVVIICDALSGTRPSSSADEFEAYRQKLLDRLT